MLQEIQSGASQAAVARRCELSPHLILKWKQGMRSGSLGREGTDPSVQELLQDQKIKGEIIQQQTREIHLFKKSHGGIDIEERKQLVRDDRQELPVQKACAVMELSRSTYYYRQQKSEAKRDEEQRMIAKLEEWAELFPKNGIRRMTAELNAQGFAVNRKRVYRLMTEHGLLCKVKRRFVITTDSNHSYCAYPNLYQNNIPDQLDRVWVADITSVRLRKRHALLAVILDACSRA